ncbi:uncharacterized protein LOC126808712 [Patella vulgata]|uniref:uncharacterized protein LOC126808712 n=1 Tax=Patella vulgata TaxID=6465 RepID=UPI0021808D50|nr:uncharacterized protein LOC126808712 [Patella vulgata]
MLIGIRFSIMLFLGTCQTTPACICVRKQLAGNNKIELIMPTVKPADGGNVCLCCYSKITRIDRTVYFYRNDTRVCEVKDSGPVNWEVGNFTCKRVNGTLTIFEVNPMEFNVSGITCRNKPNFRQGKIAPAQGLPPIEEQNTKDSRNRIVESNTIYNSTSFNNSTNFDNSISSNNSTNFDNSTSFNNSTSITKDPNRVIPLQVSLASFALIIVALIILVVLVVKRIIHSLKLKRYESISAQRRDDELLYITLPRSSSVESHVYESVQDLAVTPGIKLPCTSPGTRARSDSTVVAELPKVTNSLCHTVSVW